MRTILLMALLGIALLGMFLVVVILLGGNWVRRLGSRRRGPIVPRDRARLQRPFSEGAAASDFGADATDDAEQTASAADPPGSDTVDDLGETRAD